LGCAHNCKKASWEGAVGLYTEHEEGGQAPKITDVHTIIGEVDEDGVGMPIPSTLADVLRKFVDKMPDMSYRRCSHLGHIVDHHIELELGLQTIG
jgi:hypothetical protein